ncbi:MAG: TolC family outer membrane protein [Pseudomonadota bacterium]
MSVLAAGIVALTPSDVRADTLYQALAAAYRHNPALLAQRRAVEAVDEGVSQARSGFRPRVVTTADVGHQDLRTRQAASVGGGPGAGDGSTQPAGYTIQLSQNIFRGFQSVNGVRQAEANVLAQRETLRVTEQNTLFSVVTAYMDVLRDRAIIKLRRNNLRVLSRVLRATEERFSAGDVSRTDVAQAKARRASAVSALDLAIANVRTSEATYQQLVGRMPGRLVQPSPPTRNVPDRLQTAIQRAVEESPAVLNAAFIEQAAAHNVDQITGELLPSVDLEADYTRRFEPSEFTKRSEIATFMARLNMPLYQGGAVYSRIRQARRTREQRGQEIANQRRIARQNMIAAWSARRAALAQVRSDRVALEANQTALQGVRAEENVGQRSILDVLDAEQELLDAQVNAVITKRDLVVATYNVITAAGRMTAADLGLHVLQHDPEEHYGLVRSKPWGTRVVRGEAYEDYVQQGWEDRKPETTRLAGDVIRMAREAHGWAVTELRRDDRLGHWDGADAVLEEDLGDSLKDTDIVEGAPLPWHRPVNRTVHDTYAETYKLRAGPGTVTGSRPVSAFASDR